MAVGALLDLGVPAEVVTDALDKVGVGGHRLGVRRTVKAGIGATDVTVDTSAAGDAAKAHGHHPYRDIRARIEGADLDAGTRDRALDIFARIARAEASIHQTNIEDVEFHEVGAIDSIVDVVAAAAALAHLEPAAVTATPVAVGHGSVGTSHGRLPVPAPATVAILAEAGAVMEGGGASRELCTPTGAAILASAVTAWAPMPALVPVAVGYGAGDADLPDRPNVMRALLGEPAAGVGQESVYRIEAGVDDMRPELAEAAAEALFSAGAIDVWLTPVIMKKSRPGVQVSALAPEPRLEPCLSALFAETTTIGARYERVTRRVLDRRSEMVETRYGTIPIKIAYASDGQPINAAPEYEACREAARGQGVSVKAVMDAALAAYHR